MSDKKPDKIKLLVVIFCRRGESGLYMTKKTALKRVAVFNVMWYKLIHRLFNSKVLFYEVDKTLKILIICCAY